MKTHKMTNFQQFLHKFNENGQLPAAHTNLVENTQDGRAAWLVYL